MGEMEDYSGEFRPDISLQDFSKEALERLWRATNKLYVGVDAIWQGLIEERYGKEVSLELERKVWRTQEIMEARRVDEAMNIRGDDVSCVFKFFQLDPGIGGIMETEYDLKDKNHGVFTVKSCQALGYFERHGKTDMQKFVCETLDKEGFQELVSEFFNPKMKMVPLKLPPRESKDDIACQWKVWVED